MRAASENGFGGSAGGRAGGGVSGAVLVSTRDASALDGLAGVAGCPGCGSCPCICCGATGGTCACWDPGLGESIRAADVTFAAPAAGATRTDSLRLLSAVAPFTSSRKLTSLLNGEYMMLP